MANFGTFMKKFHAETKDNLSFVGYTHFGYRGYFGPRRAQLLEIGRPFFSNRFEYWGGRNAEKNIAEIKCFIQKNGFEAYTVKDYFKLCRK